MKKILLSGVSVLAVSGIVHAASLEETVKPGCADMGYSTSVQACINEGGAPLLCPFSELENTGCICVSQSCRGYPLQKDGTQYYITNDSGTRVNVTPTTGRVEDYIDGAMESCTVGFGADKVTYYRVPKCKGDYRFQNYICDEGCDTVNRYPYNYHPGNLPGKVEECVNESGKWYGYVDCNEGWTLDKGKCNLNSCDIKTYPYISDPNLMQYRGRTLSCKIGGNTYYKYTNVDKDGVTLTEDTCDKNGFTLRRGVCVAKCEVNTSCGKDSSNGYNVFRCGFQNPSKCRVGDDATVGGKVIGTIFYIGTDKALVMGNNLGTKKWGGGVSETTDVSYLGNITSTAVAIKDMNGKNNTYQIMRFKATNSNYSYPAAEACTAYSVSGCSSAFCAQGEWYLPSEGELGYMYDNRYILYNATGDTSLYGSWYWSSTEGSANHAWGLNFSSGGRWGGSKIYSRYVRPVLAF